MTTEKDEGWVAYRPGPAEIAAMAKEVDVLFGIQQKMVDGDAQLKVRDRVAHQYQIAGGRVTLEIDADLPAELRGVGLFQPGASHIGVARISTGLGTPHLETNPDFLGLMAAFQTRAGRRVDFLAINDPSSPADDHRIFLDLLHAGAASAGAKLPVVGDLGAYDLGNLMAEQKQFAFELKHRLGWIKTAKVMAHIAKATSRVVFSSTAYQPYWTGIAEVSGRAGKFTWIPTKDENHRPGFRPGAHHLTEEWKQRQARDAVEFILYWIPWLDEKATPTRELTMHWREDHKIPIGMLTFPRADLDSEEAGLWADLAGEMGANPGNWIHDREDSVREPATEFGLARKLAYANSQSGRDALAPVEYEQVFTTGEIDPVLAAELGRRREAKKRSGHRDRAE